MQTPNPFDVPAFANLRGGLTPLPQVIADAKARSDARHTVVLPNVRELNLRYVEPCNELPRGGYMGTVEGRDLPLGDTGYKTACKLIKSKPEFFKQHADPNAFPQNLRNIVDNPNRPADKAGVLVRTGLGPNGIHDEIAAILNPDYRVRDAHETLDRFGDMLADYLGGIKGVNVIDQGNGAKTSYRLIVGENIMPSLPPEKGQFMMFVHTMSELGLMEDQATLGLYRLICTNGAMRLDAKELVAKYNHQGPQDKFFEAAGDSMRHLGFFGERWGQTFEALTKAPLPDPAEDVLAALNDSNLLANGHYDAAATLAATGPVNTQFDFYNLLTRAAQDLPSIQARQQAETSALFLFTEPGGMGEQLRQAQEKRRARRPSLTL